MPMELPPISASTAVIAGPTFASVVRSLVGFFLVVVIIFLLASRSFLMYPAVAMGILVDALVS